MTAGLDGQPVWCPTVFSWWHYHYYAQAAQEKKIQRIQRMNCIFFPVLQITSKMTQ